MLKKQKVRYHKDADLNKFSTFRVTESAVQLLDKFLP